CHPWTAVLTCMSAICGASWEPTTPTMKESKLSEAADTSTCCRENNREPSHPVSKDLHVVLAGHSCHDRSAGFNGSAFHIRNFAGTHYARHIRGGPQSLFGDGRSNLPARWRPGTGAVCGPVPER